MPQLFAVALARVTEDPNDPLVRERQRRAQGGRGGGPGPASAPGEQAATAGQGAGTAAGQGGGRGGQNQPPAALTTPNLDRIDKRAVAITSGAEAVQGYFLSTDGRTIYFRSRDDQGPALFSIGIDGRDRQRLVAGAYAGMTPTADRRRIFFTENNELWGMELTGQRRRTRVAFTVNVRVDERDEWAQILNESWRVMKYRFYDPEMHGKDWNAIRAKYEPLLKYVGSNEDVYDLANEMIGELNASHTGVSGPDSDPQPTAYQTRYLGFEMAPDAGGYKVTHIYRDGPADKEWVNIKVGDYITAIDGTPVKAGENYWERLNSPLNEYVTVSVASAPTGGTARDVRLRSVPTLNNLKYQEWVAEEPRVRGQGDQRPDRLRPHPVDEPAVARALPERDQPVLAEERDHRRHPLQRRRQHGSGAHRHSRAAAVRVPGTAATARRAGAAARARRSRGPK